MRIERLLSGCMLGWLALAAGSGCSFSDSSRSSAAGFESSSNLVSSPFESSSGGGAAYETDVSEYTSAYVKSSPGAGGYAGFQKGVAALAEKRGISDWESDRHTYIGMGRGLRKAGVEDPAYQAYSSNFAAADADRMKWIQQGYDSGK